MKRAAVLVAIVVVVGLWPLSAAAQPVCVQWDPSTGACTLMIDSGSAEDNPASGSGGASGCTTVNGDAVDCRLKDGGVWNRERSCYVLLMNPQPAPDKLIDGIPVGEHPGKLAFQCYQTMEGREGAGAQFKIIWLAASPAVDPLVLARQAISQMNLSAITVGIVPDPLPGRVGIIGMPTWMWAEGPSENTTGPITRSASSAGNVVTATATVKRVVWDMGDGHSVTCAGPGTKYEDRYGKAPSPTCGYTYTRQGDFTVTATSYWEVAWNGMGQSGVIPLTFSRSASITMGEIQVLRR